MLKITDNLGNSLTVQCLGLYASTTGVPGLIPGQGTKDFPGGSMVKNLPAKQEMQAQSLDWEDPLEKELATHSNILARIIPWMEEPGGLQFMGLQGVGHD